MQLLSFAKEPRRTGQKIGSESRAGIRKRDLIPRVDWCSAWSRALVPEE